MTDEALDAFALRERRHSTRISAKILRPPAKPRSCRIVDISSDGARLELLSPMPLPSQFDMYANGRVFRVALLRASGRFAFVKFLPRGNKTSAA